MKQFMIMMLMIILGACTTHSTTQVKEIEAREDNLPKPKLVLDKTLGD